MTHLKTLSISACLIMLTIAFQNCGISTQIDVPSPIVDPIPVPDPGTSNICPDKLDINGDTNVDAYDIDIFRSFFGTSAAIADLNCNGFVNSQDLGLLKNASNLSCYKIIDFNMDNLLDGQDDELFQNAYGTQDLVGDFDCDNDVDFADVYTYYSRKNAFLAFFANYSAN